MPPDPSSPPGRISVVIPARDEAARLPRTLEAVRAAAPAGLELEILVVDDGSRDDTTAVAERAGARVIPGAAPGTPGNPGASRNRGAEAAGGDPIVFLDADCVPEPRWLDHLLAAHARGYEAVGGSTSMPGGLPLTARSDFFASAYHMHPRRAAGFVGNHPPCNLSVRRDAFRRCGGFEDRHPVADGHEELRWQAKLRRDGGRLYFEPSARVAHHNRPGLGNLMRRSYRWGYSALEAKAAARGAVRWSFLYRNPVLLIAGAPILAVAATLYVLGCWLRAGRLEAMLHAPAILVSRFAYTAGLARGAIRDLLPKPAAEVRPRWR